MQSSFVASFFPPGASGPRAIRKGGCRVIAIPPVRSQPGAAAQAGQGPAARPPRRGPAGRRARRRSTSPSEPLKLTGAQHVVAREHGFPSWPRLKAYVERLAAHGPDLEHAYHEDLDYYEGRAYGLHASARDGTASAVAAFERWDAPVTEAGARAVVARRHGFASWAALRRHVAGAARLGRAVRPRLSRGRGPRRRRPARAARDLPRSGRRGRHQRQRPHRDGRRDVRRAPRARPARRGRRPGARQRPRLDAAAPGGLLQPPAAGAHADRRGRARRRVRARRRRHAARRRALLGPSRGHRGPGRARRAPAQPARRGRPRAPGPRGGARRARRAPGAEAGAHRAYYRPHSGFPDWRPSDDPQEVLDEALAWAARSDRVEVLEPLVARGARPTPTSTEAAR